MADFKCFIDEKIVPDSMCFDSGTTICEYSTDKYVAYIEVRGYVSVWYREELYRHYSDFTEELKNRFIDGSAYNDPDIDIQENNWYEIFVDETKSPYHNIEYDVCDIDGTNVSDLESICKDYVDNL